MPSPVSNTPRPPLRSLLWPTVAVVTVVGALIASAMTREPAVAVAAPTTDTAPPAPGTRMETAVLAGGCFWGVQGVFQRVEGVDNAVSGYIGGSADTANYDAIGTGTTGHAEAVRISYNPQKISYGRLLQIYFSVAHDPTELNRQGPDIGTQYRSSIFPTNAEQARVAHSYIDQLNQSKAFRRDVATTVELTQNFYPAESYHQDFLAQYPSHPYIAMHDMPKIRELKRLFPQIYRENPVLVSAAGQKVQTGL